MSMVRWLSDHTPNKLRRQPLITLGIILMEDELSLSITQLLRSKTRVLKSLIVEIFDKLPRT